MKAILEFNLPEEQLEFEDAIKGSHNKMLIDDLYDKVFRPHFKYDLPIIEPTLSEAEMRVIEAIWKKVADHIYPEEN